MAAKHIEEKAKFQKDFFSRCQKYIKNKEVHYALLSDLQKLQTNSPHILSIINSSHLFKEWPSIYENREKCNEIIYDRTFNDAKTHSNY